MLSGFDLGADLDQFGPAGGPFGLKALQFGGGGQDVGQLGGLKLHTGSGSQQIAQTFSGTGLAGQVGLQLNLTVAHAQPGSFQVDTRDLTGL